MIITFIILAYLAMGAAIYLTSQKHHEKLLPHHPETSFSVGGLVGCMAIGPVAAIWSGLRRADLIKMKDKLETARREADIKAQHGPDETDDLQTCCQLKLTIQAEINRLEEAASNPPSDLETDFFIRDYMPELECSNRIEVYTQRVTNLLERHKKALQATQTRIDELQKLAQESDRLNDLAADAVYRRIQQSDLLQSQGLLKRMTVREAINLMEKNARFSFSWEESQTVWFDTATGAAAALTAGTGAIIRWPGGAITGIADWLSKDIGAPLTAAAIARTDSLSEAGEILDNQMTAASALYALIEEERFRLNGPNLPIAVPTLDQELGQPDEDESSEEDLHLKEDSL